MGSIDLQNLIPGKTYGVVVRARDDEGNQSPNSVVYTFTTPTSNLDGTALIGYNSTVNVAVGASGAMTAGTLDLNGLQKAGQLDLNDVWNTTNLSNGGGYASITGNIGGVMILNKNGLMGYQITSDSSHIDVPITASFNTIPSTINQTTARSLAPVPIGSVLTIGQAVGSIKVYSSVTKITASTNLLYNDSAQTASGSNVGAKMFVNFYNSAGTFLGNIVGASIVVPNAQGTANYLPISSSATASAYPTANTAHVTVDFYPIAGSSIATNTSFFFTNPITTNSGEIIGSSSGIAKFLLNNKTGDVYFGGTIFTTSKIGTLPIVDWTASQINNSPLVGSAYNVAASALLSADSASTNALNYLGVKNTSISGSALISSANTITNASNQLTTISANGITITTASGASASSASGARIVLNSVGFASYNASGSPTVTITAADGTARFSGSVIATAGLIGGFNLTASNQNGDAQMYIGTASQQNWTGIIPGTQWSFFSGATDNLGTSALFRVSNAGLLYAQNAVITGTITAQYGVIGNWNIGLQSLWAGNAGVQNFAGMIPGTSNVFFGGATSSAADNATFRVTNTGSVLAIAGQIGGWNLSPGLLSTSNIVNYLGSYDPIFSNATNLFPIGSYWTVTSFTFGTASTSTGIDLYTDTAIGGYVGDDSMRMSFTKTGTNPSGNYSVYMYKENVGPTRFSGSELGLVTGQSYTFSAYVYQENAASARASIEYSSASSGGSVGNITGTLVQLVPGWQRISASFTANSASYYSFYITDPGTYNTAGFFPSMRINAIQLNIGNSPTNYSDNYSASINSASSSGTTNILSLATNGSTTFNVDSAGRVKINSLFSGSYAGSPANTTPRIVLGNSNWIWSARNDATLLYLQRLNQSGTRSAVQFYSGSSNAGVINTTAAGMPAFATTSDYRVKKDILPITNVLDKIKKSNAYSFRKIDDPENKIQYGFIAHEIAEHFPSMVLGEKDAVDEFKNPIYQEVMEARIIPFLTQALKESALKIEELEQRLAFLENK